MKDVFFKKWYDPPPSKAKLLKVIILAVVILSLWSLTRENYFGIKVETELEVDGNPVIISYTVKCRPFTSYSTFEKSTAYRLDPLSKVWGHRLENGSAVLIWTPEVCPLVRGESAFAMPKYNAPVIGWLEDSYNTDEILVYTSPYAYKNDSARIAYKAMSFQPLRKNDARFKKNDYSWLGTTYNVFHGRKYRNEGRSYLSDPYHQSFIASRTIDWEADPVSPFKDIDLSRIKDLTTGTNFKPPLELYDELIQKNKAALNHCREYADLSDDDVIKISDGRSGIDLPSYAFGGYQIFEILKKAHLRRSFQSTPEDDLTAILKTRKIGWVHVLPVEIKKGVSRVRKDMEGMLLLYSPEYLERVNYEKNIIMFGNTQLSLSHFMQSSIYFLKGHGDCYHLGLSKFYHHSKSR